MNRKAFTLLELLLVIAIIIILGGLVIYLLRPVFILQDAKDAQRTSDEKMIKDGVLDYTIRNIGLLPGGLASLPAGAYDICVYAAVGCTGLNLDILVNNGIMSEIPIAPDCPSTTYTCYELNWNGIGNNITLVYDPTAGGGGSPIYADAYIIAGNQEEYFGDSVVDSLGNIYTTGYVGTRSIGIAGVVDKDPTILGVDTYNGPAGAGTQQRLFLSKINVDGTYGYTYIIGDDTGSGSKHVWGEGIGVDSAGNIYVAGRYQGTVDFDPTGGTDTKVLSGSTGWGFLFN